MASDSSGDGLPRQPIGAETLDYMIELTAELKEMAGRAGYRRLGLALTLAEEEARLQMREIIGEAERHVSTGAQRRSSAVKV